MIYAGIDAGSRAVKVVLLDEGRHVIASGIKDQGFNHSEIAFQLLDEVLGRTEFTNQGVDKIVATGYGRDSLGFADTVVTEITCHAMGVHRLVQDVRTIIDIGGQDSKLIRLGDEGQVRDFVMNDRCAAGTGRFLEVVANRLEIDIMELGRYVNEASAPAVVSSTCVVFAETEIIGLLASGESRENIVAGVQFSIASRIGVMAGRNVQEPVVFTGGVALIPGMDQALKRILDRDVHISPTPQMTGALGAALLAAWEERPF